jgi:hypothetical protein
MIYACAARLDMTKNLKNFLIFWWILCPAQFRVTKPGQAGTAEVVACTNIILPPCLNICRFRFLINNFE